MAKFSNSETLVILKDHDSEPGNTPPTTTHWTVQTTPTAWGVGQSITIGLLRSDSDKFFIAKTVHTSSFLNEPPDPINWTEIHPWAAKHVYAINDFISFSGIVYKALIAHTSIFGPDDNGDVDISEYMVTGEYEDAVPQSLKLFLNTKGGRFLTSNPKIKKFDRIYFESTIDGKTIKDVFRVRTKSRKRIFGVGMTLQLDCPHESEDLWKRTISFPGRKFSGNEALIETVAQLNSIFSKGILDPTVELPTTFDFATKTGSRLSRNTANDYIFEADKLESVLKKIKDIEQQPVEGGGTKEAMYIRFISKYDHSNNTGLGTVLVQAFEQGFTKNGSNFNNTPKVTLKYETIESGNRPTVLNLDTVEDPPQTTNVIAVGHKKSGSYPVDFQKFLGAKDVFNSARIWQVGLSYLIGDLAFDVGKTYESKTDHIAAAGNKPPNAVNWVERTFVKPSLWVTSTSYTIHDLVSHNDIPYKAVQSHTSSTVNEPPADGFWVRVFFPPTLDYSPLTKDRKQEWVNAMAGAKHAATNNFKTAVFDHNCIIKDERHPRNPVRSVGKNPTLIPSTHLVGGNIPNSYKMLAVTTNFTTDPPSATNVSDGDFTGNDPNGVPFAGNIAEYRDPDEDGTGVWFVFKETGNDEEILDLEENNSWTFKPCRGQFSFLDKESVCQLGSRAAAWEIGAYRIINILGVDLIQFLKNTEFDCVHRVAFDIAESKVKVSNKKILKDDISGTSGISVIFEPPANASVFDRRYFAGFNIWALNPITSNSIPFGGTAPVVGSKIKLSVFDFYNMFKTHEAKVEWFGPQVEDYLPIQGFGYDEKLIVSGDTVGTFDLKGDYTMEMWFADARHNVVTIEYNHSRNDVTLNQDNSLSSMEAFAAVPGISVNFSSPEPEFFDVFQEREWQFGGILTKDSYDGQGRYKAKNSRFNGKASIELILDAFRMIKPLVSTSTDEPTGKPTRNIETLRQKFDGIISYAQLKVLTLGIFDLLNFERKEITHDTPALYDIEFGDPVYSEDSLSFDESDDSKSNTILAVADRIVYTFSKPVNGEGGIRRKVYLVTRLFV